ncbi:hypothetical protein [Leisingera daeponensis]|uniref:hypothetical protein n=1 Tax=Leisingera daeponensis TaxID=405746 RepID=UPI001C979E78|nr:hypothetical protein [Leisingera daeponensis]MBY6058479.1 hypothetical protein [Leisingera daeponensis]
MSLVITSERNEGAGHAFVHRNDSQKVCELYLFLQLRADVSPVLAAAGNELFVLFQKSRAHPCGSKNAHRIINSAPVESAFFSLQLSAAMLPALALAGIAEVSAQGRTKRSRGLLIGIGIQGGQQKVGCGDAGKLGQMTFQDQCPMFAIGDKEGH